MLWAPARRKTLLLGLLAACLVILLELPGYLGGWVSWFDPLQPLEDAALDLAMKLRRETAPEPGKVAVVGIDMDSLDRYGRWPWSRPRVASLLNAINHSGARIVAVDLLFSHRSEGDPGLCGPPVPDIPECHLPLDDCVLARTIASTGNLVLGYILRDRLRSLDTPRREAFDPTQLTTFLLPPAEKWPELPLLRSYKEVVPNLTCFDAMAYNGFANHPSRGHVIRHYQIGSQYRPNTTTRGIYLSSLAVTAAARYLGADPWLEPQEGDLALFSLRFRDGEKEPLPIQVDERGRLLIDHLGAPDHDNSESGPIPTVSAWDLLDENRPNRESRKEIRRKLAGALVFVGVTEATSGDIRATPLAESVPGVQIHANVAYNLLARRFLKDGAMPHLVSLFAVLGLGLAVAFLVSSIRYYLAGPLTAIGLVAAWPVIAFGALAVFNTHLLFVAPLLAGLFSLVATLRYQHHLGSKLGNYVSPKVRQKIMTEDVELTGKKETVTILFCDIRDFSAWSGNQPAEDVVELLNEFFESMTEIIHSEEGTLDKYTGDGLMAFFGAPYELSAQELRACRAALRMQQVFSERWPPLDPKSAVKDKPYPDRIGIGLHTGQATVGDTGSKDIVNYTAIGDSVNLASRVEGLTKFCRVKTLATKRTWREARNNFLFRSLGRHQPKGTDAVELFEVVAAAPGTPRARSLVERFEEGRKALFERPYDLDLAQEVFTELKEHERDEPSEVFLDLVEGLRNNTLEFNRWKGVIFHTKK